MLAPDGGDAQRLVSLVDYIAGDYPMAVEDGAVVSPAEYEEQLTFAADARRLAGRLLGAAAAPTDPLLVQLGRGGRAAPGEGARRRRWPRPAAPRARRRSPRFGLQTRPVNRPSLARAEELYAASCATCHGARGDADTERARDARSRRRPASAIPPAWATSRRTASTTR